MPNTSTSKPPTQLSLFDNIAPLTDIRPLPLIIADKWQFPLAYVDQDGDPDNYLYCARDWYIGLEGTKQGWSFSKKDWFTVISDWSSSVDQSEKIPAVLSQVKRVRRKPENLEFVNTKGLYTIAQRMYEKPDKRMSAVRSEIIDYLAKSGVLVDKMRLDPEIGVNIALSRYQAQGKDNLDFGSGWGYNERYVIKARQPNVASKRSLCWPLNRLPGYGNDEAIKRTNRAIF